MFVYWCVEPVNENICCYILPDIPYSALWITKHSTAHILPRFHLQSCNSHGITVLYGWHLPEILYFSLIIHWTIENSMTDIFLQFHVQPCHSLGLCILRLTAIILRRLLSSHTLSSIIMQLLQTYSPQLFYTHSRYLPSMQDVINNHSSTMYWQNQNFKCTFYSRMDPLKPIDLFCCTCLLVI